MRTEILQPVLDNRRLNGMFGIENAFTIMSHNVKHVAHLLIMILCHYYT